MWVLRYLARRELLEEEEERESERVSGVFHSHVPKEGGKMDSRGKQLPSSKRLVWTSEELTCSHMTLERERCHDALLS